MLAVVDKVLEQEGCTELKQSCRSVHIISKQCCIFRAVCLQFNMIKNSGVLNMNRENNTHAVNNKILIFIHSISHTVIRSAHIFAPS